MEPSEQLDAYEWLLPTYRVLPCRHCDEHDAACERCRGTGRGAPVSRTDAIRRVQEARGHVPCFGALGTFPRDVKKLQTPSDCGELTCPFRRPCTGLHAGAYDAERIREDSIELLSRIFLNARAIERRTPQLSLFRAELAGLIEQWTDDTPQVAVIGAFSAGKSTLLNHLVGQSLLPAGRTPTTAVVTSIQYGARACGILHFRSTARVTPLSQDACSPDPAAVSALKEWLRQPRRYGVRAIAEIDGSGDAIPVDRKRLLRELVDLAPSADAERSAPHGDAGRGVVNGFKRIIRPVKPHQQRLARTFEIEFVDRPPLTADLDAEADVVEFGEHLTEPALALSLRRAVCSLPDERLRQVNLLDTAGLCSPVGFHKDVTADLLKRRPDKILVLLDSRRLDSPTNREALEVLRRFVAEPDDYRQVTFALTFWDLALYTHMREDSEPELDYYNHQVRREADRRFASWRRQDLAQLLSASVGVRCAREPVVFTLGLGDTAPQEMRRGVDALWRHLVEDCGGWVGIEMWTERWRAARGYAADLDKLLSDTAAEVEQETTDARAATNLDAEASRIEKQSKQIAEAAARAAGALRDVVQAEKERMLAEVNGLESRSALLAYLDSGYGESANSALDQLEFESERQGQALLDLHQGARALRVISLDRKLLGLDDYVRAQARDEVSGLLYGLKSIWDFLLGGVVELNEGNRAAAREILRGQARDTLDILESAVDEWTEQAQRVCEQALAEYAEQQQSLAARKKDEEKHVEGLGRKLRFLGNWQTPVRDLRSEVEGFVDGLEAARSRITASRQPDFEAVLYTDDGAISFRKDPE